MPRHAIGRLEKEHFSQKLLQAEHLYLYTLHQRSFPPAFLGSFSLAVWSLNGHLSCTAWKLGWSFSSPEENLKVSLSIKLHFVYEVLRQDRVHETGFLVHRPFTGGMSRMLPLARVHCGAGHPITVWDSQWTVHLGIQGQEGSQRSEWHPGRTPNYKPDPSSWAEQGTHHLFLFWCLPHHHTCGMPNPLAHFSHSILGKACPLSFILSCGGPTLSLLPIGGQSFVSSRLLLCSLKKHPQTVGI